jgi:hypothetical protein
MDNQPLPPMQPLPPTDQVDISYLDQIAVKPKVKNGFFSGRMLVLLGIAVVAIGGAIAIMVANGGKPAPKTNSETLYLRATNLQKTAAKYHRYLKNSSLRAANATYQIQLTDLVQNLKTELAKVSIKVDKIDKKLKTTESTRIEKIDKAFEDSRLNVRLDRDYAKEMSFQIDIMITLMQKIEKSAKTDYKTMLEATQPKLKSMAEQFSKFEDD